MNQGDPTSRGREHFMQMPWCAAILQQADIVTFIASSRAEGVAPLGGLPSQDQLFRRSLWTGQAIPECIGFYQDPSTGDDTNDGFQDRGGNDSRYGQQLQIKSSSLMFDLQPGVNGFNGSAHGGLIAALMDEAMGNFLLLNSELQHREKAKGPLPLEVLDLDDVGGFFTAEMSVKLRKPIATPQVVVVTAFLQGINGRKMAFYVTVRGENGVEYATCDGLWISLQQRKL